MLQLIIVLTLMFFPLMSLDTKLSLGQMLIEQVTTCVDLQFVNRTILSPCDVNDKKIHHMNS